MAHVSPRERSAAEKATLALAEREAVYASLQKAEREAHAAAATAKAALEEADRQRAALEKAVREAASPHSGRPSVDAVSGLWATTGDEAAPTAAVQAIPRTYPSATLYAAYAPPAQAAGSVELVGHPPAVVATPKGCSVEYTVDHTVASATTPSSDDGATAATIPPSVISPAQAVVGTGGPSAPVLAPTATLARSVSNSTVPEEVETSKVHAAYKAIESPQQHRYNAAAYVGDESLLKHRYNTAAYEAIENPQEHRCNTAAYVGIESQSVAPTPTPGSLSKVSSSQMSTLVTSSNTSASACTLSDLNEERSAYLSECAHGSVAVGGLFFEPSSTHLSSPGSSSHSSSEGGAGASVPASESSGHSTHGLGVRGSDHAAVLALAVPKSCGRVADAGAASPGATSPGNISISSVSTSTASDGSGFAVGVLVSPSLPSSLDRGLPNESRCDVGAEASATICTATHDLERLVVSAKEEDAQGVGSEDDSEKVGGSVDWLGLSFEDEDDTSVTEIDRAAIVASILYAMVNAVEAVAFINPPPSNNLILRKQASTTVFTQAPGPPQAPGLPQATVSLKQQAAAPYSRTASHPAKSPRPADQACPIPEKSWPSSGPALEGLVSSVLEHASAAVSTVGLVSSIEEHASAMVSTVGLVSSVGDHARAVVSNVGVSTNSTQVSICEQPSPVALMSREAIAGVAEDAMAGVPEDAMETAVQVGMATAQTVVDDDNKHQVGIRADEPACLAEESLNSSPALGRATAKSPASPPASPPAAQALKSPAEAARALAPSPAARPHNSPPEARPLAPSLTARPLNSPAEAARAPATSPAQMAALLTPVQIATSPTQTPRGPPGPAPPQAAIAPPLVGVTSPSYSALSSGADDSECLSEEVSSTQQSSMPTAANTASSAESPSMPAAANTASSAESPSMPAAANTASSAASLSMPAAANTASSAESLTTFVPLAMEGDSPASSTTRASPSAEGGCSASPTSSVSPAAKGDSPSSSTTRASPGAEGGSPGSPTSSVSPAAEGGSPASSTTRASPGVEGGCSASPSTASVSPAGEGSSPEASDGESQAAADKAEGCGLDSSSDTDDSLLFDEEGTYVPTWLSTIEEVSEDCHDTVSHASCHDTASLASLKADATQYASAARSRRTSSISDTYPPGINGLLDPPGISPPKMNGLLDFSAYSPRGSSLPPMALNVAYTPGQLDADSLKNPKWVAGLTELDRSSPMGPVEVMAWAHGSPGAGAANEAYPDTDMASIDKCDYKIEVKTDAVPASDAGVRLFVELIGTKGRTSKMLLANGIGNTFDECKYATFMLECSQSSGPNPVLPIKWSQPSGPIPMVPTQWSQSSGPNQVSSCTAPYPSLWPDCRGWLSNENGWTQCLPVDNDAESEASSSRLQASKTQQRDLVATNDDDQDGEPERLNSWTQESTNDDGKDCKPQRLNSETQWQQMILPKTAGLRVHK
eukprot:gene5948-33524_t